MRMLRRLSILAAALVVAGQASAASSLEPEMREVEQLRRLTFVHSVKERTIDRSQLRPLIREQIATLEEIEAAHQSDGDATSFSASVRALRLAQTRTALAWLHVLELHDGPEVAVEVENQTVLEVIRGGHGRRTSLSGRDYGG